MTGTLCRLQRHRPVDKGVDCGEDRETFFGLYKKGRCEIWVFIGNAAVR